MLAPAVLDPSHLFQHLGYAAILVIVLLGNAGVPAPEESVLVLGGYLAWHGRLHLPLVILVGVVSASLGDNLGFWAGRHYGRRAVARLPLPPARGAGPGAHRALRRAGRLRRALRAGPAHRRGTTRGRGRAPPLRFFAANLLGAICYVPWPVLAGYGVGYGLGDWIERLRRAVGLKEDVALFAAILALAGMAFIAMTWAHRKAIMMASRFLRTRGILCPGSRTPAVPHARVPCHTGHADPGPGGGLGGRLHLHRSTFAGATKPTSLGSLGPARSEFGYYTPSMAAPDRLPAAYGRYLHHVLTSGARSGATASRDQQGRPDRGLYTRSHRHARLPAEHEWRFHTCSTRPACPDQDTVAPGVKQGRPRSSATTRTARGTTASCGTPTAPSRRSTSRARWRRRFGINKRGQIVGSYRPPRRLTASSGRRTAASRRSTFPAPQVPPRASTAARSWARPRTPGTRTASYGSGVPSRRSTSPAPTAPGRMGSAAVHRRQLVSRRPV